MEDILVVTWRIALLKAFSLISRNLRPARLTCPARPAEAYRSELLGRRVRCPLVQGAGDLHAKGHVTFGAR